MKEELMSRVCPRLSGRLCIRLLSGVSTASPPLTHLKIAPVYTVCFFFLNMRMQIISPVVHVNYEQPASTLFLMCLGRAA